MTGRCPRALVVTLVVVVAAMVAAGCVGGPASPPSERDGGAQPTAEDPFPEGRTIIVGEGAGGEGRAEEGAGGNGSTEGSEGAGEGGAGEGGAGEGGAGEGGAGEGGAGEGGAGEGGAGSAGPAGAGGSEEEPPSGGSGTTSAPTASPAKVNMRDSTFLPATIEIEPGQTVVWTNTDDRRHTVTGNDGSWKSPTMEERATFEWTFDEPGRYGYVCAFHPRMTGVVIVADG